MTTASNEALRERYARERAKRLRPDGNEQYLEFGGRFRPLLTDPYTERAERAPVRDHVTFAFIGGGFAGLVTAARLREAGVPDVRIVEKAGGFGGTWYWNRYPGAQCDTAAMIYMPLLEETGHMPGELYAHAPEILAHCDQIGKQYGLHDDALFHTQVTALEWDEGNARWVVRTDRGDEFTAQFVGMGTGPLHVPKLPGIPGIESFEGHCFHTSRWDYAYTGGPPPRPARRQAGRDHRHRRDLGAVRAAPGRSLPGALRLPAHPVLGRHPGQPADGPWLVRPADRPGMAAALAGQLRGQHGRDRVPGRGPGGRRLDRPGQADPRPHLRAAAGPGRVHRTAGRFREC
jgi:hypothetical protein